MRTRRSVRNQDIMWKYLSPKVVEVKKEPLPMPKICSNCVYAACAARSRFTCKLTGEKTYSTSIKDCFTEKTKTNN